MFNTDLYNTFEIFSTSHLFAALVVFVIIGFTIYFSPRIRESKYVDIIRITLASAIIIQEVLLNVFRLAVNEWEIGASLPLHLCGLGVITSAIILLTKSKKLFVNTFFILMIGAFMAILTPSIENNVGFPHFRFFQFFFSHGMIFLNFTFILFVMEYHKEVKYRHLLNNFVVLLALAVVLYPVNLITGGNYLFLMGKPGEGTAIDLFGVHPWYIINVLIFGVPVFFHIFYLPFFIKNIIKKRKAL
jgi:hypothetical integral membrane protein (TIGR02206 family)